MAAAAYIAHPVEAFLPMLEREGMDIETIHDLGEGLFEVRYVSMVDGEPREPDTYSQKFRIEPA